MKSKICIFFLVFILNSRANSQEIDLFNYSNSFKFANYLYSNGEYAMAIAEYKRILFIDSPNVKANIKIHDSFIRSGNYSEGIKFSDLIDKRIIVSDTLLILRGKLLLLTGDYKQLNSEIITKPIDTYGLVFLNMSKAMFLKNWDEASEYLPKIESNIYLQQFAPIIKKTSEIQYKSPVLSLTMSALVPGSGKAYSGYWKDGLFSFLFVGITAWQSYRGFNQKGLQSAYGWLMGGISFSFYGGNIYGSLKAANKKNYEIDNSILNEFEETFITTYSNF
jgi:hypothetical protein